MTGGARHRLVAAAGLLAATGIFAASSPAAAHGFGQRYDLPIPLAHYIWGAGATVALSFVLLALFLRAGRAVDTGPTVTLSLGGAERGLGIAAIAIRFAAVVLLLIAIVAGLFGDQNPFRNIAPTLVWIIGWVGIAFLSFILGDVWRLLNPWAALYDAAAWIFRPSSKTEPRGVARYPPWLGAWPAVILFVVFAWMELAWSGRSVPANLAAALALYSVLTLAGLAVFGRAWLDRGEIFCKVFGLFARFAPVAWPSGSSHGVVLRLPGAGLMDERPLDWAQVALTIAVLATVTFDGLLETPLWARLDAAILDAPDDSFLWTVLGLREEQALRLARTVALPAIVLLFIAAYVAVCGSMAALARDKVSTAIIARRFVLTLVPIAIAYHVAHYFSYLFVGGQYIIPLISDPFGWGWNLFGTAAYRPDIGIVGPRLQWYVAVVSVVLGHVIAVCLSHVVGLRLFPDRRTALVTQIPMIALMIAYTMCSLWILSQPIVESPAG